MLLVKKWWYQPTQNIRDLHIDCIIEGTVLGLHITNFDGGVLVT